jgi:carboxymethylenebutenolidase
MRIPACILIAALAATAFGQSSSPPAAPSPGESPATQPATRPTAYGKPIATDINPGEIVTFRSTNREIQAYFVTPKVTGPTPAVLYVHDIFGMTDYAKAEADKLAHQGYAVLMPNLYSRLENADHGFDAQNAWLAYDKTSDPQVLQDLQTAIEFLNKEGKPTAGQPLAVVGHDMGGIFAMKLAGMDLRVTAAVNFYGRVLYTNTSAMRPTSPVEDLFNLNAPLLSFYGNADPQIPPAQVAAMESRLENNPNKTYYELVKMPGVGHGFLVQGRQGYNAQAAEQSEERMKEFLARYLRAEPKKMEE